MNAAKLRPFLKLDASPIDATSALAASGPTPGSWPDACSLRSTGGKPSLGDPDRGSDPAAADTVRPGTSSRDG